ncbi:MAG TPA: HD domain-containing protein [Cerasibacillus sp.]|uniref:HD domain-containing protein n=1 Tax=Cerasibacillus sp. TaxID=2498711 RepID=UPI002F402B82
MMEREKQLQHIQQYVYDLFSNDTTGHDFFHLQRVALMAEMIAEKEGADSFLCRIAAWLHDVGDHKLFSRPQEALLEMESFLYNIHFTEADVKQIILAIRDVSFSKGRTPHTIEGKIVQDADRLDAIGAIGIARTFAYGGAKGQPIYDPINPKQTSIDHFFTKLIHLKELLHTQAAIQLANERHLFLEHFLQQFFTEWYLKKP